MNIYVISQKQIGLVKGKCARRVQGVKGKENRAFKDERVRNEWRAVTKEKAKRVLQLCKECTKERANEGSKNMRHSNTTITPL